MKSSVPLDDEDGFDFMKEELSRRRYGSEMNLKGIIRTTEMVARKF